MKVLCCHPGHAFSTVDVFHGLCVGLEANGVEVVAVDWDRMLRPLSALVTGAIKGDALTDAEGERMHKFAGFLASGDVLGIALDAEVDAVIMINGLLFPPSRAKVMQKLGIPVACYGTESPYFDANERDLAPFYSHWFTNERTSVARFQELTHAFYLPHAYNPLLHVPGEIDPARACDAVFVGGGFPERKQLIEGVDWSGIDYRVLGTLWHLDLEAERGKMDFERGNRWTVGAIPNEETSAWHRSAKIALNLHRKMTYIEQDAPLADSSAESLGPRAYEIPACGGFMLCDDERPEIFDVFGESAATFRAWDSGSLEREIRYWLAHPDRREACARMQHESVKPHSWAARARYVLECIID